MPPLISLCEACQLQSLLSARHLSGACVSAGRLVILEINVPPRTSVAQLIDVITPEADPSRGAIFKLLQSNVRQYPDGSLKMDFHFASKEDATAMVSVARATMCVPSAMSALPLEQVEAN